MFECINRALQLKDAITRFSENEMELNGWTDGEDDEDRSDGEGGGFGEEMSTQRIPILCCSLICWNFSEVYVFLVFTIMHITGVWAYFQP